MSFRIFSTARTATRFALIACAWLPHWLLAASSSDLLITLDVDGQSYTAQHTLMSDQDLLSLELPPDRVSLQVRFGGPETITFQEAHRRNPNHLTLWSGSVFTRYRHHYSEGLTTLDNGIYELDTHIAHAVVSTDGALPLHSTITWIMPTNATLLTFIDKPLEKDRPQVATGRWQTSGNTLTYEQRGGPLPALIIQYTLDDAWGEHPDPCLAVIGVSDECSPDVDLDQVPDYRDVCLPGDPLVASANSQNNESASNKEQDSAKDAPLTHSIDAIGCSQQSVIALQGVRFQSGQSYLDAASRQVLDRVALALQIAPDQLFEVSSHTDNAGRKGHNQRLSENRADAVRHYLMLRGVGPNQLDARGYGEMFPRHSNRLAAGRRANRRIELRRLN